MAANVDVV